jgi:proline iminopeptidase
MAGEVSWKYPEASPYDAGMLAVDATHTISFEQYGNRHGRPVIYLHGGPGGGCSPKCARFFDPAHYRIVLFDQRGCGKSTPFGSLDNNTTTHLIEDINQLRSHLGFSEPVHIFGGSWGSTLALAYAIKHPENVKSLTLRGIFLGRDQDVADFYQGDAGTPDQSHLKGLAARLYPEYWESYVAHIPAGERGDMVKAYHALLNSPDDSVREQAAERWSKWEDAAVHRVYDAAAIENEFDSKKSLAIAIIENHYFMNGCFLGGNSRNQNYILENIDRIKDIPTEIVHGRYDAVCPRNQADEFVAAWNKVQLNQYKRPVLHITDEGHSWSEPENIVKLTEITDRFRVL